MADQLAVDNPGLVVDGATPARFSTERIYDHFEEIRVSAALNGCEFGGATLEGVVSGVYNGSAGVWSGDWESSVDTGTASGSIDRPSKTWSGSYAGDTTGDFGDLFASYDKTGKLVGNRDDGFLAGRWIRIRGSRGIFVAVHGTCAGDPEEAISSWYGPVTVEPFPTPVDGEDLVLSYSPADVTFVKNVITNTITLLDDTTRTIVEDEVLAVCPGFAQPTPCRVDVSVFDVRTPSTILGTDIDVGCVVWDDPPIVDLVLDGGSFTTGGFTFIGEPRLHVSSTTTLEEVARRPSITTIHPTVDFGNLFDSCPL